MAAHTEKKLERYVSAYRPKVAPNDYTSPAVCDAWYLIPETISQTPTIMVYSQYHAPSVRALFDSCILSQGQLLRKQVASLFFKAVPEGIDTKNINDGIYWAVKEIYQSEYQKLYKFDKPEETRYTFKPAFSNPDTIY